MAINIAGFAVGYRIPPGAKRPRAADFSPAALHEPLTIARGEQQDAYFTRLARDVHLRMAFYWNWRSDRVAITDNWLLNLAGHFLATYRTYEFVDPNRALRRGYGLCSEDADVMFGELQRSGFHPSSILLPDHTVVQVRDGAGRSFILDGLFGVVLPYSYAQIVRDPARVAPYYRQVSVAESPDGEHGPRLARKMVGIYSTHDVEIDTGRATPHTAVVEPISYVLKWLIPALLLSLAPLGWLRRRRWPGLRVPVLALPERRTGWARVRVPGPIA